ncbi:DUF1499 domain-containing protein [Oceanomicrobium pacificus]|uniref:DUF1499 domain-containing protein n=1 Tax=Oceanomicrobium pacificus TaxID=2692916 RepID=A0A6B0TXE8_9RHOB|nr:DUF1499 domain-containing protein [Oceanomicrobium pacificus]MXU65703.1 DUF1499 domain-containing protein [Oceanomicrobium pacificus]
MKLMITLVLLVAVFVAGLTFYRIQFAESDPAVWHVDPLTASPQPTPNGYRVASPELAAHQPDQIAPVYGAPAAVIMQALDDYILAQSNTERLAGSVAENWATYIQRTPTLKFPDYISIKVIPIDENTATVAIFSRSRFGHGDMGVNEARVKTWLESISTLAL